MKTSPIWKTVLLAALLAALVTALIIGAGLIAAHHLRDDHKRVDTVVNLGVGKPSEHPIYNELTDKPETRC